MKPDAKSSNRDTSTDLAMSNVQTVIVSLKSSAKQLVVLEDELVEFQASFNQQLRDLAREKILIRDNIQANNNRLREIHEILKEKGEAPVIDKQATFHPAEYTSCSLSQTERRDMIQDANKYYFTGTIHDSDFLLHGDIDLSLSAAGLKSIAESSLQSESEQLITYAQSATQEFENSLGHIKQTRFEVASRLKLKQLLFELLSKQVEVLLTYDAKDDSVMGGNMSKKENDLKLIQSVVPVNLSDVDQCEGSDGFPTLITKKILDDLNIEIAQKEAKLKEVKLQALCLRRDRKRLNNKITEMKKELIDLQRRCEEIQIQKFGKQVGTSVLDISPATKADQAKEVDKLQNELESFHQRDIDNAKKDQVVLKGQLLSATNENTKLLREIASLREQQMKFDQDIKCVSSSNTRSKAIKACETSEYEKFRALSFEQKGQIEVIQQEIKALKSKCGHVAINNSICPSADPHERSTI